MSVVAAHQETAPPSFCPARRNVTQFSVEQHICKRAMPHAIHVCACGTHWQLGHERGNNRPEEA